MSKDAALRNLEMICPYGKALVDSESNEVVQCYADSSREDTCPSGHHCVPANEDAEHGFCCPRDPSTPHHDIDGAQTHSNGIKYGQCPYLIPLDTPIAAMSCEVTTQPCLFTLTQIS